MVRLERELSGLVAGVAVFVASAVASAQAPETGSGQTAGRVSAVFGPSAPLVSVSWDDDAAGQDPSPRLQTVSFDCAEDQCVSGSGMCAPSCGDDQTWVVVAPYLWAPAMKGTVGAGGNLANVDLTLSDLFDLIEDDLNGAVMGHVEVGKGPRGLIFDTLIMQVSPTEPGPLGGTVSIESNLTIFEVLGMYRVLDMNTGRQTLSRVKFDLLGGARYYQVQGGVTIIPVQGPTIVAEQSENWVDLVVGARGAVTIVDGLDAFLRADFAGFGIGTSSKLAWHLVAGVEYACGFCPGSSLLLGYKLLDIDESKYSGAQQFVFDVKLQGPFLALAFRF